MTSINDCSFKDYEFVNGIEQDSQSESDLWVVRSKEDKRQYLMKIFDSSNNQLQQELLYYQRLTQSYQQKQTRNVLPLVKGGTRCSISALFMLLDPVEKRSSLLAFARNLTYLIVSSDHNPDRPKVNASLAVNRRNFSTEFVDMYNHFLLLLERKQYTALNEELQLGYIMTPLAVSGIPDLLTFADYWDVWFKRVQLATTNLDVVKTEMQMYIFQLVYTLLMLENVYKFSQNDLHFNNILMDSPYPDESKQCVYQVVDSEAQQTTTWRIDTPLVPRIFDFDRSSANWLPNTSGNKKRVYVPRRDLGEFACHFIHRIRSRVGRVTGKKKLLLMDLEKWVRDMMLTPNSAADKFSTKNKEKCNGGSFSEKEFVTKGVKNNKDILAQLGALSFVIPNIDSSKADYSFEL